jgi:uncharacterized damage-inducible protein DinB
VTDHPDDERDALLEFLAFQRASVLAVVADLNEEAWQTSVVPSGWTPAGLVEHLGGVERHWFLEVVDGVEEELPWDVGLPPYDAHAAMTCARSSEEILGYYRDQCARADAVLARTPLSAAPRGRHGGEDEEGPDIVDVRRVVLHVIEETAAHSGHLEIARELLDGRTGLGLR